MGKQPVWSLWICPVTSIGFMYTQFVRIRGLLSIVMMGGELWIGSGVVLRTLSGVAWRVDRRPFLPWRRCPLPLAMDFGRCVRTSVLVNPGHVAEYPASMALSHVDGTGLPHAWRRYRTMSPCFVNSWTLLMEACCSWPLHCCPVQCCWQMCLRHCFWSDLEH